MDPVFCIPYSEYAVAVELSNRLKKKDGYSICVPLSRQQKGYDLLVYCSQSKTTAAIQVKASRFYPKPPPERKSQRRRFQFGLWFNNFSTADEADFYILFGPYPKNISRAKWWGCKILLFKADEMKTFLNRLRNKSGKRAHSFGLEFNEDSDDVFLVRGARGSEPESMREYLLEERIKGLQRFLKKR